MAVGLPTIQAPWALNACDTAVTAAVPGPAPLCPHRHLQRLQHLSRTLKTAAVQDGIEVQTNKQANKPKTNLCYAKDDLVIHLKFLIKCCSSLSYYYLCEQRFKRSYFFKKRMYI